MGFSFQASEGPAEQALYNRLPAACRTVVEHPFRIVKRQFGYTHVRYRGLYKNVQQLYLLFALGNLYHIREAMRPS